MEQRPEYSEDEKGDVKAKLLESLGILLKDKKRNEAIRKTHAGHVLQIDSFYPLFS